jgi:hypothetical protein
VTVCFDLVGLKAITATGAGIGGVALLRAGGFSDFGSKIAFAFSAFSIFPDTQFKVVGREWIGLISDIVDKQILSADPIVFIIMIYGFTNPRFVAVVIIHRNFVQKNLSCDGVRYRQINHVTPVRTNLIFQTECIDVFYIIREQTFQGCTIIITD